MTLTAIKITKRGRVALFADEDFLLSMHPDDFALAGLSVGSVIDGEQLTALTAQTELKKAKEKAFSLLSSRDYTASQLRERLLLRVEEEVADEVVLRMEELGLINDEDYAERFARELWERKRYGLMRIRQELRMKGLSAESIESALSLLQEDPAENIRAILEKKYPAAAEDETVRRRAYQALLRMGHRSSDVRHALDMFGEDEE